MIRAENLSVGSVEHAFFTRRGGVSSGIYASLNCGQGSKDDPSLVTENRQLASDLLGVPLAQLCTLYQVHSREVVFVTRPWTTEARPQADAMVTNSMGLALGILTADCVPILFSDPIARVIGAAHAGWQGAFNGVIGATVAAMNRLGAEPQTTRAAIGPAIAQASYEVGPEFHTRFLTQAAENERYFAAGKRSGHFQFDLTGYVKTRLQEAGIGDIEHINRDTYDEPDFFFSYRRAVHRGEPDYGRQLSAIALVGPEPA
ncbi:MAG: peptidoglycan editing factor PgeF [Alphaproteobacteria bacterium]